MSFLERFGSTSEVNDTSHPPLLEVRGLTKYFPVKQGIIPRTAGQVHAVDDISFTLERGETLGLVGESGCGKSTVGKALLRLVHPTKGSVKFEGREIVDMQRRDLRALRRDVQIIFQDPFESLNSRHTVRKILSEPFIIHKLGKKIEREQRVNELLNRVGLDASAANRYPHEFSGGQRQRIGIARAIALKPKLVVCDEAAEAELRRSVDVASVIDAEDSVAGSVIDEVLRRHGRK